MTRTKKINMSFALTVLHILYGQWNHIVTLAAIGKKTHALFGTHVANFELELYRVS